MYTLFIQLEIYSILFIVITACGEETTDATVCSKIYNSPKSNFELSHQKYLWSVIEKSSKKTKSS